MRARMTWFPHGFGLKPGIFGFFIAVLIVALVLLAEAPGTTAVRARRGASARVLTGDDRPYSALDDADDDDDYVNEDQQESEDDSEDSIPERRPMHGRRIIRKANQYGQGQGRRRRAGQRQHIGGDESYLKDSPGSWHWYLLWGSILSGTLAITGGGASYAYLMFKSQFNKIKPGLQTEREHGEPNLTVSLTDDESEVEEGTTPPADAPNNNWEEEIKAQSEYLTLEDDFKTEPRATFAWCQSRGLLRSKCPYCDEKVNHDCVTGGQFHCPKCSGRIHVLEGTWFEVKPMEIWKALSVLYHWTLGNNHVDVARAIDAPEAALAVWYKKCRDVTDYCLRICDPQGPAGGEATQAVTRDHYNNHDHANCSLYKLGGKGQVVEVDVLDKGQALTDKFVILCVDRDSGNALAFPTKLRTPKAVRQLLVRKLKEGTIIAFPFDEATGRENRQYLLPQFKRDFKKIIPANFVMNEELLPVYVSQLMWMRKHEDCTYDHFRIMTNHISKYFRFP